MLRAPVPYEVGFLGQGIWPGHSGRYRASLRGGSGSQEAEAPGESHQEEQQTGSSVTGSGVLQDVTTTHGNQSQGTGTQSHQERDTAEIEAALGLLMLAGSR